MAGGVVLRPPRSGEKIEMKHGRLEVPPHPVIPYLDGDSRSAARCQATRQRLDAAVQRAYGKKRRLEWLDVSPALVGEQGMQEPLGDEAVEAFVHYLVGMHGSLPFEQALYRSLDLYAEQRHLPEADGQQRILACERSEASGPELSWAEGSDEARRLVSFLQRELGVRSIRFPETAAISLEVHSREASERLLRASFAWARERGHTELVLVDWVTGRSRLWSTLAGISEEAGRLGEGAPRPRELTVAEAVAQLVAGAPASGVFISTRPIIDLLAAAASARSGSELRCARGCYNLETGHALFSAWSTGSLTSTSEGHDDGVALDRAGELLLRYLGWGEALGR